MQVIKSDRLDIYSWCSCPESGAIDQARHVASLPFAVHHVALLPDTHQGYGMPIGCVLAAANEIIPNAVGVDIGCGVLQGKVTLSDTLSKNQLEDVMGRIRSYVPVGFNKHKDPVPVTKMPSINITHDMPIVEHEWDNASISMGTLGGGNHFIEIQRKDGGNNTDDYYIMIHSGSRNLGKKVCDFYNKMAVELNKNWNVAYHLSWDLAYLPVDHDMGQQYLNEMKYCISFAQLNRLEMMYKVFQAFREIPGVAMGDIEIWKDCIHNYVSPEFHFGRMLWIHRKGAVRADTGQIVLIPGSQGTASYRGIGLGNPDSFASCSHGAGRRMSRGEARRTLNLSLEQDYLNARGIIHNIRTEKDLDEASSAYKNIDTVMQEQADLVKDQAKFFPIAVIKG